MGDALNLSRWNININLKTSSKSVSMKFAFTLFKVLEPLKHKRAVLRTAKETLHRIQEIVAE